MPKGAQCFQRIFLYVSFAGRARALSHLTWRPRAMAERFAVVPDVAALTAALLGAQRRDA